MWGSMTNEHNHLNDIMRNGILSTRHLLKQADHRLGGMEQGLALLGKDMFADPHIRLIIPRLEQTEEGALGTLLFDGRLFCTTLEPDAGDPERNQIPAGIHPIKRFPGFPGSKFKNTIEVIVPDHTAVLFHNGCIEKHSEMCVLLAYEPGYLFASGHKVRAILNSRKAYKRFQQVVVPSIRFDDKAAFVNFYL